MNNEEAKFILQGYRPNGADAGDTTFVAAVEQAKKDPALGEWFAKQQAFDAAISAKLAEIAPPADLRAAILAGGKVTAAGAATQRAWWNHPVWMGLAACLAIVFATAVALWPKQASAFGDFIYADAKLSATHGGHGHETSRLQAVLNDATTRLGQKLPINFEELSGTGCRALNYRGHEIMELCFKRDGVWFHCYIARIADYPMVAMTDTPTIVDRDGTSVASWKDAEHLIVVVSKSGRRSLEALL
jgi:hypothetical protein